MTKKELLLKLRDILDQQNKTIGYRDIEGDHIDADKLLLKFINDKDITDVFDKIGKWYY